MINHDRLFKELLTTFFIEFLELFFPQVVAYLERQLQERIRSLSLVQLEDLGEALLDFSDVADLSAWLDSVSIQPGRIIADDR